MHSRRFPPLPGVNTEQRPASTRNIDQVAELFLPAATPPLQTVDMARQALRCAITDQPATAAHPPPPPLPPESTPRLLEQRPVGSIVHSAIQQTVAHPHSRLPWPPESTPRLLAQRSLGSVVRGAMQQPGAAAHSRLPRPPESAPRLLAQPPVDSIVHGAMQQSVALAHSHPHVPPASTPVPAIPTIPKTTAPMRAALQNMSSQPPPSASKKTSVDVASFATPPPEAKPSCVADPSSTETPSASGSGTVLAARAPAHVARPVLSPRERDDAKIFVKYCDAMVKSGFNSQPELLKRYRDEVTEMCHLFSFGEIDTSQFHNGLASRVRKCAPALTSLNVIQRFNEYLNRKDKQIAVAVEAKREEQIIAAALAKRTVPVTNPVMSELAAISRAPGNQQPSFSRVNPPPSKAEALNAAQHIRAVMDQRAVKGFPTPSSKEITMKQTPVASLAEKSASAGADMKKRTEVAVPGPVALVAPTPRPSNSEPRRVDKSLSILAGVVDIDREQDVLTASAAPEPSTTGENECLAGMLLHVPTLRAKVKRIMERNGLEGDCTPVLVEVLSRAIAQRTATVVESAGAFARARTEGAPSEWQTRKEGPNMAAIMEAMRDEEDRALLAASAARTAAFYRRQEEEAAALDPVGTKKAMEERRKRDAAAEKKRISDSNQKNALDSAMAGLLKKRKRRRLTVAPVGSATSCELTGSSGPSRVNAGSGRTALLLNGKGESRLAAGNTEEGAPKKKEKQLVTLPDVLAVMEEDHNMRQSVLVYKWSARVGAPRPL